ncbi:uncharacterized protein LOC123194950 [Mangifera indica]|uniref:uncharacterized protein LOC123194950 n=1 Tax=Mangifera indica TaxID=29780 RepID=UPI001CFA2BA0|nr:uncharacterized protein LOC123194950 [Mangifera indica]
MASHMVLGLVDILRDALKIFYRNGKLMASFTLFTLSLFSLLYLFNIFSMKPLLTKWITDQSLLLFTSPNTPEYANLLVAAHKDMRVFIGTEWILLLITSFMSFFFSTATIFASATTHNGKKFSLKDLFFTTAGSLKRPFLTLLYITLFGVGYIFLALFLLLPLMMSFQSTFAWKVLYVLLWVSAAAFYGYLAVVWTLALVVSVLEESYGIEALEKAANIVKGMEMHGFLVNIAITILSFIVLEGFRLVNFKDFGGVEVIIGLLILNSLWLVKMFGLMAYTVLYYQCKKTNGEEVELNGDLEYRKTPSLPFINENIP